MAGSPRKVTELTDDRLTAACINGGQPERSFMKRLDSIPDWVVAVLAVVFVAGVFKLFGGIGVLVLAIISTVIWIAQTIGSPTPADDRARSNASGSESEASSPSRPR